MRSPPERSRLSFRWTVAGGGLGLRLPDPPGFRSRGAPRRPSSSLHLRSSRCSWTGSIWPPPRPRTPPIDLPEAYSTGAGRCRSLPARAHPTEVRARPTARLAPWGRPESAGIEFEGGSGREPPGCSMGLSPRAGCLRGPNRRLPPRAGSGQRGRPTEGVPEFLGGTYRRRAVSTPAGFTSFASAGGVATSGFGAVSTRLWANGPISGSGSASSRLDLHPWCVIRSPR